MLPRDRDGDGAVLAAHDPHDGEIALVLVGVAIVGSGRRRGHLDLLGGRGRGHGRRALGGLGLEGGALRGRGHRLALLAVAAVLLGIVIVACDAAHGERRVAPHVGRRAADRLGGGVVLHRHRHVRRKPFARCVQQARRDGHVPGLGADRLHERQAVLGQRFADGVQDGGERCVPVVEVAVALVEGWVRQLQVGLGECRGKRPDGR